MPKSESAEGSSGIREHCKHYGDCVAKGAKGNLGCDILGVHNLAGVEGVADQTVLDECRS